MARTVEGQLAGLRLTEPVLDAVRSLAGAAAPSSTCLRRRELERELAERAAAHAARRLSTEAYLAEHTRLSAELDALDATTGAADSIDPEDAVAELRNLAAAWQDAAHQPETRRGLVRALFRRLTVLGDRIVDEEPSPSAYRFGLDLAIPDYVVLARPAGFEPAT